MHKPNAIDAAVDKALADWGIPFSARYMGEDDRDPDPERAIMDHWHVTVGKYRTDFYTGIGLRGPTISPQAAGRPAPRARTPRPPMKNGRKSCARRGDYSSMNPSCRGKP